jgi:two-component system, NtrC family, response regulator HydG
MTSAAARPRLLVVDDDASVLPLIERFARSRGFDVSVFQGAREALAALPQLHPDAALVDLQMPELSGIDVLKEIAATEPECQVILMTGNASVDSAIEAVKAGALDYLSKPLDFERLTALLDDVSASRTRRERLLSADAAVAAQIEFNGIIGRAASMQQLFVTIRRLAPHARTVLITGETGTGKELVARALHAEGPRRAKRFLTLNCAAVVDTLFESELFGHVRGAFTGATDATVGMFEHAHHGTLFLDEIGELPAALQPKLLRAIEHGEIQRVGSLESKRVDVRVIAATNRDLLAQAEDGRFRSDLYYRLSVVELRLPPLRERLGDIPYLTAAFVRELADRLGRAITGLTPEAERLLTSFHWPGNVRELRNTIERACMLSTRSVLSERDLLLAMPRQASSAPPGVPTPATTLESAQKERIEQVLRETGGNKAAAAKRLGVSRRSMYRYLERFDLKA